MIDQLIVVSVVSVLLLLVAGVIRVRKQRPLLDPKVGSPDGPDTVAGWPPQATRVLTVAERNAYELLNRALPGYMVLAQLPLSRFIKVPTRYSYAQWLRRVGNHCVDLVVADPLSRVIAVIEVRSLHAPDKSLRRHERVTRVLDTVGIPMHQWVEGDLPTLAQVQSLFNVGEPETARAAQAQAHLNVQPLALPPVNPATVTFFIANEALPEEHGEALNTQVHEYEPSTTMVAAAMANGVASRDTPPTTWYDEFDTPLPSFTAMATHEAQAETDSAAADTHKAMLLQYKPH